MTHPFRRSAGRAERPALRAAATGLTVTALVAAGSALAATPALADPNDNPFGPNVTVFDPSMSATDINAALAASQNYTEFGTDRHAFLFKPGTYGDASGQDDPSTATGVINGQVGYYETVAGLGTNPDDVTINGAIHAEGTPPTNVCPWDNSGGGDSVLDSFWRSLSNMAINPIQQPVAGDTGVAGVCYPTADNPNGIMDPEGTANAHQMRWAVSQASPLRRLDVKGDLSVFPSFGGFASGGYIDDSRVSGTVSSGSQQQWFTNDSQIGTWDGAVWNQVFSGVNADAGFTTPSGTVTADELTYPTPAYTVVPKTPVSRDAPFVTWDAKKGYGVFVPDARTDSSGVSWAGGTEAGTSLKLSKFFVADPSDSAEVINAQLAAGKDLILTPGVYSLDEALDVSHNDQVVLGLGMATLSPTNGNAAVVTGDVKGVKIAGLTIDAGAVKSDVLVQVGPQGAKKSDASDPTTLSDVFVRIGGAHLGSVDTAIEVNTDHTLLDDIWSWRADHGTGVGWTDNTADHGLVVNGADVTATGLFVEHYQKQQVVWNGNGGTTIFFQSEMPYDPPTQADWMDGSSNGYPSYDVASDVTSHTAYGLGIYSFFDPTRVDPGVTDIQSAAGIIAPKSKDVTFTHAMTRFLNGIGGIDHVINDTGSSVSQSAISTSGTDPQTSYLASYPGADTTAPTVSISSDPAATNSNGVYTTAPKLTITGTDDFTPGPTVEYSLDGSAWQPVTGPITVADGTHTVQARATDDSGNVSSVATWTGKVDTAVGPTIKSVSVADGDTVSGKATFKVKLAGPAPGVSYTYIELNKGGTWVTDNTVGTAISLGSTNSGLNPKLVVDTTTLANGTYGLKIDAVGTNGKTTEQTLSFTVHNAPVLKITNPGDGATVSGKVNVKVKLSGNFLQAYNLRIDSAGLAYTYQPTAGTFTYKLDTTTLTNGVHTLLATATNTSGDKTTVTEKITVAN